MGEPALKFTCDLDASGAREIYMRLPIDLAADEAERIKRAIDELVNTRQPNDIQAQEIRDICSRFATDLAGVRSPAREPHIRAARDMVISYLVTRQFSAAAIADYMHREIGTIHSRIKSYG